jgi:hypothetical protein
MLMPAQKKKRYLCFGKLVWERPADPSCQSVNPTRFEFSEKEAGWLKHTRAVFVSLGKTANILVQSLCYTESSPERSCRSINLVDMFQNDMPRE